MEQLDIDRDAAGLGLLGRVSAALLGVRAEDPGPGLEQLLEVLVGTLGAGSGSLYRLDLPRGQALRLARWGAFFAPDWNYSLAESPDLAMTLLSGNSALFSVSSLPQAARQKLDTLGIHTGMVVPMGDRGAPWGLLAFWWGPEAARPDAPRAELRPIATLIAHTLRWLDAEKERARVDTWFRLYAEASTEAIGIEEDGRFVDLNEPALRLLGSSRDELIGTTALDLAHPAFRDALADRIRTGSEEPLEILVVRADGSTVWCEVRTRQARVDGERVRMVVAREITDRIRSREIEERALAAQRLEGLGLLASGIAHDFNNILTGVLGNAELASMAGELSPRTQRALSGIRNAALHASRLTRQLLAYAGRSPGSPVSIDLNAGVREILPLIEVSRTGGKLLDVQLGSAPLPVRLDPSHLDQVLLNLVTNAFEAVGPDGRVRVRTEAATLTQPLFLGAVTLPAGDYAVLEVEDDGSGIPACVVDRVFDPFFSTKAEGRGLGLAAVYGIVRQSCGGISVTSTPGRGASFRVFLPAGEAVPSTTADVSPSPSLRAGRVLVIDDEAEVRFVLRRSLEHMGFAVDEAPDGPAGLSYLGASPTPDAVLLDLSMPGMAGDAVHKVIREKHPRLPVLVCTGAPDQRPFGDDPRLGWLQKPFSQQQLAVAIAELLERA